MKIYWLKTRSSFHGDSDDEEAESALPYSDWTLVSYSERDECWYTFGWECGARKRKDDQVIEVDICNPNLLEKG